MSTVFDVASELISRSGGSMETVKLQKLCFYTFGWYAHLTSEAAFDEPFYAMAKGPVVGELLSAHAGKIEATVPMMCAQQAEREETLDAPVDPYLMTVIDAVWDCYGRMNKWVLVDKTHEESIWVDAWASRRPGTKRGDIPHDKLISYFVAERQPKPSEGLHLPPPMVTHADAEELRAIEEGAQIHQPFLSAVRSFHWAA